MLNIEKAVKLWEVCIKLLIYKISKLVWSQDKHQINTFIKRIVFDDSPKF